MKTLIRLTIICFLFVTYMAQAQDDTSEAELQGILDAFEDDKSESVEGMKVDLKSIQFQTGTDKLVTTDTKYIDRILDYFKSLPTVLLEIDGHTDNVGNKKSNQTLSEKRALAVKNYLVQNGVSAERIKTAGFGSSVPIASNDTEEGRKQNRRVELKFSGVTNETHTINLADGSQVQAQFIMINRDGSIGYKETLKSPMKKLKAPEIRNIAFHNGTNYVPKDDPMVIRKTEAAAAIAQKEAEDPTIKEQELREKKMREELLLKEQQLREQQLKEQQERELKEKEQGGKKNSIGFFAHTLPPQNNFSSQVVGFEFEHFSNPKNSVAVKIQYINFPFKDKIAGIEQTGDGSGVGIGFSYKHFFGKPYQGFFFGPAIELAFLKIAYDLDGGSDPGIGLIPNLSAGYRINLGDSFSISPYGTLGYRVTLPIGSKGTDAFQSSPISGIGAKFSWRF